MWPRLISNLDLSLKRSDFRTIDFLVYRLFRLLFLPFGKKLTARIATHLHWIFRHLAVSTSSHYFGIDFLNSRSAIVRGELLQKHVKGNHFVVDVACGTARYIPLLKSVGISRYLGIDNSILHINHNRSLHPDFRFILADAIDAKNIPNCDVLIASHFLEHLDNPNKFLDDVSKICKILVLEVPDFFSDPINIVSFEFGSPWWTDRDHRREYSKEALEELLLRSNYRILETSFSGGTIGVVAVPE